MLRTRLRRFAAVILAVIIALAWSACQSDRITSVVLSGGAFFPPEYTALGELQPVPNSPFRVLDLSLPADDNVVATGVTDVNGNYFARINPTPSVAVVVLGEIRVSGLADSRAEVIEKNFDGITDIACEAGVSAIVDGSVSPLEMDSSRIDNLEAGAVVALQQIDVDFTNEDGSRTAAVNLTRELTNDGANPPAQS